MAFPSNNPIMTVRISDWERLRMERTLLVMGLAHTLSERNGVSLQAVLAIIENNLLKAWESRNKKSK